MFALYVGGMVMPYYLGYCIYKIVKIKKVLKEG